jgi:hypothetical protein
MIWERVQENWIEYQESAKHTWDKLSMVELEIISGDRDKLVHRLEDAYGFSHADAEREVETWHRSLS